MLPQPAASQGHTALQLKVDMSEVMILKWNMASSLAVTCTDHLTYIISNSRSADGLRFGLLLVATCGLVASRDVFLQMSQLRRTTRYP